MLPPRAGGYYRRVSGENQINEAIYYIRRLPQLIWEFKRYSGTTPAAFARKAKKGKQAVSNDFVAFIQA
jgi:hypothetical protein